MSSPTSSSVIYPDSDGKRMSDNTLQFRWIVTVKENLEILFRDRPDVFVAGDLLWYAVEGNNRLRQSPDAMVAFGRPKGDRGSYRTWDEGGVVPRVVFEVLSPGNRRAELARKFDFYNEHGVEEYYVIDPMRNRMQGYLREEAGLVELPTMTGWVSPALGIRFEPTEEPMRVYYPNGRPFLTPVELEEARLEGLRRERKAKTRARRAEGRAEQAEGRAERAEGRAEQAEGRAEQAEGLAQRLAAQLRAAGIDPAE